MDGDIICPKCGVIFPMLRGYLDHLPLCYFVATPGAVVAMGIPGSPGKT